MRIFKHVLLALFIVIDLAQIAVAFLLASKMYDLYGGQLGGAWRLYIFPTILFLFLVAGVVAVLRKKDWGYILLLLPLFLPILAQLMGLNTNFLDTSAVDKKNQESIHQFLQDSQTH